jgi:hypothetical protein
MTGGENGFGRLRRKLQREGTADGRLLDIASQLESGSQAVLAVWVCVAMNGKEAVKLFEGSE